MHKRIFAIEQIKTVTKYLSMNYNLMKKVFYKIRAH